jgi:type II secretory pathway pseudopilin PulG
MRRLLRRGFTLLWGQKGISLIEVLVAVGLLGAIGGGVAYALFSGFRASGTVDEYATAERLARTQLEDIRNAAYDETLPLGYPEITLPADYSISVDVIKDDAFEGNVGIDAGVIQTISITVSYNGQALVQLDTYKIKYAI